MKWETEFDKMAKIPLALSTSALPLVHPAATPKFAAAIFKYLPLMAAAVLGAAALGAAVGAGTTIYADRTGFSGRHDQSHDSQVALIQALTEKSLKAFLDGNITKEEYVELGILSQKSIAAANEYLKSVSEYKETSVFSLIRKAKKVARVRKSKRRLRDQTMEFTVHYATSMSSKSSHPSSGSGVSEQDVTSFLPSTSSPRGSKAVATDADEFSETEEVASVVWPSEVGLSLSKLIPQFTLLLQEGRDRMLPPSTAATSAKPQLCHILHAEKTLYDSQLYHVAKDFAVFYTENFRDADPERNGNNEHDCHRQADLQVLSKLFAASVILGEMSTAQLASSPDIIKPISHQLLKVRSTMQSSHHQSENISWLCNLQTLLDNLEWAFTSKEAWEEEEESEEHLNFVTEPVEDVLSPLLSPLELEAANALVQPCAQQLLRHGNIVLELTLTGIIKSITGEWQDVLGMTPTPGTEIFDVIPDPYASKFRMALNDLRDESSTFSVAVFRIIMVDFPGAETKISPLLEGSGVVLYFNRWDNPQDFENSSTMWFLKVVSEEGNSLKFTSTQTISCPICECPIPLWYIRRHCETCAEVSRTKNQIKSCNDSIFVLQNNIQDMLKTTTTKRSFPSHLKIFSSREKDHTHARIQMLEDISNVLQVALEIPVDLSQETNRNSKWSIEHQQPPPVTLEPDIRQVYAWCTRVTTSADTHKMGLTTWMEDTQSIVRQKVDNIAHLRNVIRYSQLAWRYSNPRRSKRAFESLKKLAIVKRLNKDRVFLTKTKTNVKLYVIKVIPKVEMIWKNSVNPDRMTLLRRESPFVSKLNAVFQSKRKLYLVMPYLDGGDCAALPKPLAEVQTKIYLAEVVLAIGFLHRNGIIHRDLKPDNILIDYRGHIKLTDFGISLKNLFSAHARDTYRANYLAPEVIRQECSSSDSGIDWWALGVIAYEFLYATKPFHANVPGKILNNILSGEINWEMCPMSKDALNFMKSLLVPSPQDRLGSSGVEQVKGHRFFASIG